MFSRIEIFYISIFRYQIDYVNKFRSPMETTSKEIHSLHYIHPKVLIWNDSKSLHLASWMT